MPFRLVLSKNSKVLGDNPGVMIIVENGQGIAAIALHDRCAGKADLGGIGQCPHHVGVKR